MSEQQERWSDVLDQLEFRLGRYAASLVGGEPPEPFTLPGDLGPCPADLRPRASLIVECQHDVENAIRARLGFLRTMLEGSEQPRPYSVFVDARA